MIASSSGSGAVVLVVVLVVLLGRVGYAVRVSRDRRRAAASGAPAAREVQREVSRGPEAGGGADLVTTRAAGPVAADGAAGRRGPSPVRDPVLRISGLTVEYGAVRAVDDLDLEIDRGEIFGLLGPNGAGKTSTLSAIEGLLRPRTGTVVLDGIDIARDPVEAKARMGVQLQATSFQPELTVKQIVHLYAGLYGVPRSDREVLDALGAIGLAAEATRAYKQLSGGQQQRLALYVAVLHEPALLLLDEPTSGLDPQSRRQLWGRIEHIRAGGGSILLTTHSMEEAQSVCDRVAIIDRGSVLTTDTPTNLVARHRDDPRVRAVARGEVTLEDVFIGLTGTDVRE